MLFACQKSPLFTTQIVVRAGETGPQRATDAAETFRLIAGYSVSPFGELTLFKLRRPQYGTIF